MLLAEALAERKQALSEISSLTARIEAAAVVYEDAEQADVSVDELAKSLAKAIDTFGKLSTRINRTNNATTVKFERKERTIMEWIAERETLQFTAKHYRAIADHVRDTMNPTRRYGISRSKDDVRQVAKVNAADFRKTADEASEQLRRLDSALQQANWTTELVA